MRFLGEQAAQSRRQPFFLYLCHLAVHTPLQAKPADVAYFEKKATRGWNGHSHAIYAAMLKSLDESVGRILDTLAQTGLAKDTLVVFMSDNGGVTYTNPAIREGDFKLIFDWSGKLLLYDLKHDWREEHNLADTQPAKARDLFIKLNTWIDANVAVKYTPLLNPAYDPAKEARKRPFVDLRKQILGDAFAIRPAASDPRIAILDAEARAAAKPGPSGKMK